MCPYTYIYKHYHALPLVIHCPSPPSIPSSKGPTCAQANTGTRTRTQRQPKRPRPPLFLPLASPVSLDPTPLTSVLPLRVLSADHEIVLLVLVGPSPPSGSWWGGHGLGRWRVGSVLLGGGRGGGRKWRVGFYMHTCVMNIYMCVCITGMNIYMCVCITGIPGPQGEEGPQGVRGSQGNAGRNGPFSVSFCISTRLLRATFVTTVCMFLSLRPLLPHPSHSTGPAFLQVSLSLPLWVLFSLARSQPLSSSPSLPPPHSPSSASLLSSLSSASSPSRGRASRRERRHERGERERRDKR